MLASTLMPASGSSYRELRFPQVFEAAAIGIALCHFDGRILEGNSFLARLLGYSVDGLVGLDPWRFHQSDAITEGSLLADLLRGERDFFVLEKPCCRKDSSQFWGRLTVSLAHDANHDPAFLVVMLENATERRQHDEKLRHAERMELMGRMTAGIAHDFNNLLTGFLLYSDLLLAELPPESTIRRHVEEIRTAGEQGAAMTQQLLSVVRKQSSQPRIIRLNDVVCSTENLLRRLIGEHIELSIDLDPEAGEVMLDPAQLRQVLMNLAVNARDAISENGKILIRTMGTKFPESPAARAAPAVSLVVEDNGCGMTPDTRAHLFELCFTTKPAGKGTGVGLATVQRIVIEAHGQIIVKSEPGQGTRIEVFFPDQKMNTASLPDTSQANSRERVREPIQEIRPFGTETIRGSQIIRSDDQTPKFPNGDSAC